MTCTPKELEYKKKYFRTEKGKIAQKRYNQSIKGKERNVRDVEKNRNWRDNCPEKLLIRKAKNGEIIHTMK